MFKLEKAVDFANQTGRILADPPADVALTAEISGDLDIITIAKKNFRQITIEYRCIDFTGGQ